MTKTNIKCPKCKSNNLSIINDYRPLSSRKYYKHTCNDCGNYWEESYFSTLVSEDNMITEQASIEHDKWLDVVKELRHIGVEIDNQGKLNKTLIAWSIAFHEFKKDRGE